MSTRLLPILVLFAVIVASCAPATATDTAVPVVPAVIEPSATLPAPVPTLVQSNQPTLGVTEAPTEVIASIALPVATSRGPNLEATDPRTVSMALGNLQFVEFFEFW